MLLEPPRFKIRLSRFGFQIQALETGVVLLEAMMALVILSILTGYIIQSIAASIRGYEKVRSTFEASVFLNNLLFEVKSDERGRRFARPRRDGIQSNFFTPNAYSLQVDARPIGLTQKPWGDRTIYELFDVAIDWKDRREAVASATVGRVQLKKSEGEAPA